MDKIKTKSRPGSRKTNIRNLSFRWRWVQINPHKWHIDRYQKSDSSYIGSYQSNRLCHEAESYYRSSSIRSHFVASRFYFYWILLTFGWKYLDRKNLRQQIWLKLSNRLNEMRTRPPRPFQEVERFQLRFKGSRSNSFQNIGLKHLIPKSSGL